MNTHIQPSANSDILERAYISVCTKLSSDALPKVENSSQNENSDTGVSTHFVPLPKEIMASRRAVHQPHWYALRVTYGCEKKAYDYMVEKQVDAFYPTIKTVKEVNGKALASRTIFRMAEAASPNQTILRNQRKCSPHSGVCCNNDILYGSDYADKMKLIRSTYEILLILNLSLTDTTPLVDLLNKTNFKDIKDQSSSGELLLF